MWFHTFPGSADAALSQKIYKNFMSTQSLALVFFRGPCYTEQQSPREKGGAVTMVKFGRLVFDDVDDLIFSDTELIRSER